MQLAAKCRFKASRRLRSHKQIAQVTIALLSLELIVVPTLLLGGLKTQFFARDDSRNPNLRGSVRTRLFSSYGSGEFSLKEHKHHQCGLEIHALVRCLKPLLLIQFELGRAGRPGMYDAKDIRPTSRSLTGFNLAQKLSSYHLSVMTKKILP
jgi:SMODS and SLOG-associating 2TM effector domain family 5